MVARAKKDCLKVESSSQKGEGGRALLCGTEKKPQKNSSGEVWGSFTGKSVVQRYVKKKRLTLPERG